MARPREFNEADVVQEAMGVFWQNGYQGTSVQDLVDATGLQRGSLYAAFGDKHGLYVAALDAYASSSLRQFRQGFENADDPVEAVRDLVRMMGGVCTGPDASRGCMVGNACSEMAAQDEDSRQRVELFLTGMTTSIGDALRRGQAAGTFAADRDPDTVAAFILCCLQGLSLLGKSNPDPRSLRGVVDEILRALN